MRFSVLRGDSGLEFSGERCSLSAQPGPFISGGACWLLPAEELRGGALRHCRARARTRQSEALLRSVIVIGAVAVSATDEGAPAPRSPSGFQGQSPLPRTGRVNEKSASVARSSWDLGCLSVHVRASPFGCTLPSVPQTAWGGGEAGFLFVCFFSFFLERISERYRYVPSIGDEAQRR